MINKSENNYFDSRFKLTASEKPSIGKVGVFPYNKEIKTMIRYAKKMLKEKVKVQVYVAGQEEKEICEALVKYF